MFLTYIVLYYIFTDRQILQFFWVFSLHAKIIIKNENFPNIIVYNSEPFFLDHFLHSTWTIAVPCRRAILQQECARPFKRQSYLSLSDFRVDILLSKARILASEAQRAIFRWKKKIGKDLDTQNFARKL